MSYDGIGDYTDLAVRHYSSLFRLPSSTGKVLILQLIADLIGGILMFLHLVKSEFTILGGLSFGLIFFLLSLLADLSIINLLLKNDPIFNIRRCCFISSVSSTIWFTFLLIGCFLDQQYGNFEIPVLSNILGFFASNTLRLLVFLSVSSNKLVLMPSSFLQPVMFLISILCLEDTLHRPIYANFLPHFFAAMLLSFLSVHFYLAIVDRVGKEILGIPSLLLFRGFIANWAESDCELLEDIFERLGEERSLEVSILAFEGGERLKAVMVVPYIHPGPFRNLGSSHLPNMIQRALEDYLKCVVAVLHGPSTHELDLTSQAQNRKVLNALLQSIDFARFDDLATHLLREGSDAASATCQFFGDHALIILTTSFVIEDLPLDIALEISQEARRWNLLTTVVDAHNSLNNPVYKGNVISLLKRNAIGALEGASTSERYGFEVGAAKITPSEFDLRDGMGPGGISAIVIRIRDQNYAYILIDGNNMVSGLREKILTELHKIGIAEGEILTSDTHAVCGVALTRRGYHPIGEVIDHEILTNYIIKVAQEALKNIEPARFSSKSVTIQDLKVFGKDQILKLSLAIEEASKLSKKLAVMLFPTVGFLLALLFAVT